MPPTNRRKATGAHRRKPVRWALKGEKYLSVKSIAPNSVSKGASVDMLRNALGLRGGDFDWDTREAVMQAQDRLGLPVTGVVTEADWDAIVNPVGRGPAKVRKRRAARSAAPSGGVDGAEEPNGPTGQLDPPQGP